MPKSQVASVANFDFGAPQEEGQVLLFKVRNGARLSIRFENPEGSADVTVTAQVSADGASWEATDITDVLVVRKQYVEGEVTVAEGHHKYLQVLAKGGARIQMQVRGAEALDAIKF